MGRSSPTISHVLDDTVKKLHVLIKRYLPDIYSDAFKKLEKDFRRIQNMFIAEPIDPIDALLLSAVLHLYVDSLGVRKIFDNK